MDVFKQYTLNSLKKNKVRTIVTVIGIILSVAMFTATTEAFFSMQHFLIEYTQQTEGKYHVAVNNIKDEAVFKDNLDDGIEDIAYLRGLGYAEIDSKNEYKPYLHIAAMDKSFTEMMPLTVTEGRMPENSSEIVVSEHIDYNGGVELKIGQTLELEVGQREQTYYLDYTEEELANQDSSAYNELTQEIQFMPDGKETLVNTEKKTYTIVGFCARPPMRTVEPRIAPGYTAFTLYDGQEYSTISSYMTLVKPTQYGKYALKFYEADLSISYPAENRDLLTYSLYYQDDFTAMFIGLASILIVLIVVGSISLIYNTFSISVSERTKQFGILKSIGATKKQMKNNVLFEALVLCLFGVPIGLVSGYVGIAITFKALGESFALVVGDMASGTALRIVFSPAALIAAAVIGIITVLISAYIPARKAIRISPIESIRQSKEVKTKKHSVRISPLTKLLFGFEGMVSAKYFKRNRRKYRVTVLSLFMSVVMFISASSLSAYFNKILDAEVDVQSYDLQYDLWDVSDEKAQEVSDTIANLGFDDIHFVSRDSVDGTITTEYTDESAMERLGIMGGDSSDGMFDVHCKINYVEDEYFREILREYGIDEEGYFDKNNPKALMYDNCETYMHNVDNDTYTRIKYKNINRDRIPGEVKVYETVFDITEIEGYEAYEGYSHSGWENTPEGRFCTYTKYETSEFVDENDGLVYEAREVDTLSIPWEKAVKTHTFDVGAELTEVPDYTYFSSDFETLFLYPESVRPDTSTSLYRSTGFISDEDYNAAEKKIHQAFRDLGLDSENSEVYNIASGNDSSRAIILIAKVLAYGFITLISLIAAANVFNTVSTNIALRRREIATLLSVGLTKGGLRKMMFYESLIYGLKSLVFSLPVSTAVTYLIYRIMAEEGSGIAFFLPVGSYIAAVISVFAVVLVTMVYSLNKISKENIIESLRNENI